jgi:hypothetical protein
MARTSRSGPPHQARHFQPEDHAHAAHQAEAPHGLTQKSGRAIKEEGRKSRARKSSHPRELTPRRPSRGQ